MGLDLTSSFANMSEDSFLAKKYRSRVLKKSITSLLDDINKNGDDFSKEKLIPGVTGLLNNLNAQTKGGMPAQNAKLESQLGMLTKDYQLAGAGLGKFTKEKFNRTKIREQFSIMSDAPGAAQTILTNRSSFGGF